MSKIFSGILIGFIFSQSLAAQVFVRIDTVISIGGLLNLECGDIDQDHDYDVLVGGYGYPTRVYLNNNGSFFPSLFSFPGALNIAKPTFTLNDFDNDNNLDVTLITYSTKKPMLFKNNRDNSFTQIPIETYFESPGAISWLDIDNDGDIDLYVSGDASIYVNDQTIFNRKEMPFQKLYFSSVCPGDYDSDGDIDILCTGYPFVVPLTTRLYQNDGTGNFLDVNKIIPGIQEGSISWGDYDNDGDMDVLITGHGYSLGYISRVYRNNGNGEFTDIVASLLPLYKSQAAWGDYDIDGDLDIAIIGTGFLGFNQSNVLRIYRNDGNDQFTAISDSIFDICCGSEGGSLSWIDYDLDNDLDLMVAPSSISSIVLFRNDINLNNSRPLPPTQLSSLLTDEGINGHTVTMTWNNGTDLETPIQGLYYNIWVGNNRDRPNVVSPLSDIATGFRFKTDLGNVYQNSSWKLHRLRRGQYFWAVQSIDNCFQGSLFSQIDSFYVPNHLPVVFPITDTTLYGGQNYSYKIQCLDFDKDTLLFQIKTNAAFLTIDSLGTISGRPSLYQDGNYVVQVQVSDHYGGSAFQNYNISVIDPTPPITELQQNFPNPFNISTTIRYQIRTPSNVSLTIYNILGQKVKTLVDQHQEFGYYSVIWDGTDETDRQVASGIYLCSLHINGRHFTKKLALLK